MDIQIHIGDHIIVYDKSEIENHELLSVMFNNDDKNSYSFTLLYDDAINDTIIDYCHIVPKMLKKICFQDLIYWIQFKNYLMYNLSNRNFPDDVIYYYNFFNSIEKKKYKFRKIKKNINYCLEMNYPVTISKLRKYYEKYGVFKDLIMDILTTTKNINVVQNIHENNYIDIEYIKQHNINNTIMKMCGNNTINYYVNNLSFINYLFDNNYIDNYTIIINSCVKLAIFCHEKGLIDIKTVEIHTHADNISLDMFECLLKHEYNIKTLYLMLCKNYTIKKKDKQEFVKKLINDPELEHFLIDYVTKFEFHYTFNYDALKIINENVYYELLFKNIRKMYNDIFQNIHPYTYGYIISYYADNYEKTFNMTDKELLELAMYYCVPNLIQHINPDTIKIKSVSNYIRLYVEDHRYTKLYIELYRIGKCEHILFPNKFEGNRRYAMINNIEYNPNGIEKEANDFQEYNRKLLMKKLIF